MDDCNTLRRKLTKALQPTHIVVTNFSDQHAGHAGSPNSGRSHFRVEIRAECLANLPRVQAHQRIYQVLDEEIASHIHALEIVLLKHS